LAPRNFRLDPAAARQVLAAAPHLRLVSFALPAGRQVELTAASPTVRRLADAVPAGAGHSWETLLAAHLGQFFTRYHPAVFPAGPLALAAALRLPFTSFGPARVTVSETGAMGTSTDGNVLISQNVDYRALGEWLRARLHPQNWARWAPAGYRPLRAARV
jgi:hypothetical protein